MIARMTSKGSRWWLVLILGLALLLRVYGLSWDDGYLFHPDERQVLILVDEISFPWPPDWSQLLSPESPLNPKFFAYGSLPLYLLRICASLAGLVHPPYATLTSSYVVGRVLSALFDVGTVFLVYRLGRKLYSEWVGLLAAALTSMTVLHIQLSHFYAVDTPLTFFVVLAVRQAVVVVQRPRPRSGLLLGLTCGAALATKISAAPLLLVVILAWILAGFARLQVGQVALNGGVPIRRLRVWTSMLWGLLVSSLATTGVFLICEPYALIDVVRFVVDVLHESYMARGMADIPYTRQYIGTIPYLYPLWQLVVWSLGLPLGLMGLLGVLAAVVQTVRGMWYRKWVRAGMQLMPLVWVLAYFGLVGSFHAKFLRYLLPIVPFLCLWAAWLLGRLTSTGGGTRAGSLLRAAGAILLVIVVLSSALYSVAYLNIYHQKHPWLQATAWLCEHLPSGSQIMIEHWDDPLPLIQVSGRLRCFGDHRFKVFRAYDPDDTAKLMDLLDALESSQYVVLATNRLYDTIPRLPDRYPLSSRYYALLLGERLGFELVYYSTVYPELGGIRLYNDTFRDPDLPIPRLIAESEAGQMNINLGRADESYTVYDHPKPLVFMKTEQLSRRQLLGLFGGAAENLPEPDPEAK